MRKKAFFSVLIFMLLSTCFVISVFANDVENVKASYKDGKVTVSGRANCSKVVIRILDTDGTVKGLTNSSVSNNSYSKIINIGELREGNKYIVKVNNIIGGNGNVQTSFIVPKSEVNVNNISLNIKSKKIKKGDSFTLTVTISPSNATNKDIKWSSSNNNVATVSNGKVTAKGKGKATITATSVNSSKIAYCVVEVIEENTNNNTNDNINKDTSDKINNNTNSGKTNKSNNSSSIINKNKTNTNNKTIEKNIIKEENERQSIINEAEENLENEIERNEIIDDIQEASANIVENSKSTNDYVIIFIGIIILLLIILFIYFRYKKSKH